MPVPPADSAHAAWSALLQAARAGGLYGADHPRVAELVKRHAAAVQAVCSPGRDLVLDLRPEGALFEGKLLPSAGETADELGRRLHGQDLVRLRFGAGWNAAGAAELVASLALYAGRTVPARSLGDRLRWQPFIGLDVQVADATDDREVDSLTLEERRIERELLVLPEGAAEAVSLRALRAEWDLLGGAVSWPSRLAPAESEALGRLCERVDSRRVPMLRVGLVLGEIARLWGEDERIGRLLTRLPSEVEALLGRHEPGEAARLLGPLRRWGEEMVARRPVSRAAASFEALRRTLLEDRFLGLLMGAIEAGVSPSRVASYFARVGDKGIGRGLEFAAAVSDGPHREAIVGLLQDEVGSRVELLEPLVLKASAGPALLAFDLLSDMPPDDAGRSLGLRALDRSEPVLVRRAAGYLLRYDGTDVRARMIDLLDAEGDLRSVALAWVARRPFPGLYRKLVSMAKNARFDGLPLHERRDLARTLGYVDPQQATSLALTLLGPHWETKDLDRAVPWIICLGATGSDPGYDAIRELSRRADESLQSFAKEAAALWERSRARWSDELTAPPGAVGPGSTGRVETLDEELPTAAIPTVAPVTTEMPAILESDLADAWKEATAEDDVDYAVVEVGPESEEDEDTQAMAVQTLELTPGALEFGDELEELAESLDAEGGAESTLEFYVGDDSLRVPADFDPAAVDTGTLEILVEDDIDPTEISTPSLDGLLEIARRDRGVPVVEEPKTSTLTRAPRIRRDPNRGPKR